MRRIQSLVLAGLSLALTLPAAAETASEVFKQVSPSIVVVITYDAAGKPVELGSGVMLPNHDVATNCHVLKDGTQYHARYLDKDYPAQLDNSDWDHDVCSLRVPGLPAPPVVLGNTKTLQVGAQVYAIGAPEGLELTLSEGIVSSLRPVDGGNYIQTTAAISPGSSGGGLFDDQGHLLGLTSFYMAQGQQLNFALPVEWVEVLPHHSTQRVAQRTGEVDWLNGAAALETKKDWHALMRWSRAWIKASPRNELAWGTLGEACGHVGQYAEAINADRRALQINPQDADVLNNLGLTYDNAAQYPQAIRAYRQALQINPRYEVSWYGLGDAYDDAGQHAEAIEAYRQTLQINPKDENAWYNLGRDYEDAGQHAKAIEAYRQALQINPKDADAWNNLGLAYYFAGQHAEAIGAFHQALQINPKDAKSWLGLGIVYIKTGQNAQALAAYQHLKTLSPELAQKLFDKIAPK